MEDLRALAQTQSWVELINHLQDISPSKRDADWKKLAEQAGVGVLTSTTQGDPLAGIQASEKMLENFPELKSSKAFMEKRNEVGLQAFSNSCFPSNWLADECNKALKTFVEQDRGNTALAFQAGKVARLNLKSWAATPYFFMAIKQAGDPRCKDEDVSLAVISALGLPAESYKEVVDQAKDLSVKCWQAIGPALLKELNDSSGYLADNSCPILKSQGASSPQCK
jgi:hypothetical protein